jgi:hypothetical protein
MNFLSLAPNPLTLALFALALMLTGALFIDWNEWLAPIGCIHCGAPTGDERYRCPECGKPLHPDGPDHD